ncbi:putative FMN-binding domain-containing protein [Trichoderma velutinum]
MTITNGSVVVADGSNGNATTWTGGHRIIPRKGLPNEYIVIVDGSNGAAANKAAVNGTVPNGTSSNGTIVNANIFNAVSISATVENKDVTASAPTTQWVDTVFALSKAVDALAGLPAEPPSIYVDLEGQNLSRYGTISILQIHVHPTNTTYLIDVQSLGNECFSTAGQTGWTLKRILESPLVPKVFFDVRSDSDALFALFNISLSGVLDLQLMEFVTRPDQRKKFVQGLERCVRYDSPLSRSEKLSWNKTKQQGRGLFAPESGGGFEVFNEEETDRKRSHDNKSSNMYLRGDHAETDLRVLRQLVRENPLGIFTTAISSPSYPLIQSSHLPFILDIEDESSETELGRLRAHMSRANPQGKAIIDEIKERQAAGDNSGTLQQDVLVMFTSSVQHYLTPKFYTATKPTTGKVVGTWNYAAVQIYGKATIYIDPSAEESTAFLDKQLDDLTSFNERVTMGYTGEGSRPKPWEVSEAPTPYLNLKKKAIFGLEIKIERMEGKFKMSQEMGDGDVDGVIKGFNDLGTDVGCKMASLVEERREIKKQKKATKESE